MATFNVVYLSSKIAMCKLVVYYDTLLVTSVCVHAIMNGSVFIAINKN